MFVDGSPVSLMALGGFLGGSRKAWGGFPVFSLQADQLPDLQYGSLLTMLDAKFV